MFNRWPHSALQLLSVWLALPAAALCSQHSGYRKAITTNTPGMLLSPRSAATARQREHPALLLSGYETNTQAQRSTRRPIRLGRPTGHWRLILVILGDDNAINLLARRITADNTPVVYLGMNGNPRDHGFYGVKNLTGVLERPLMKRNVHEMGQLADGAKRALILFDDSEVSRTAIEAEFGSKNSL